MNTRLAIASVPATVALLLFGCAQPDQAMEKPSAATTGMEKSSSPAMEESPSAMEPSSTVMTTGAAMSPGAYITLADYQAMGSEYAGKPVVYFFHAGWCPDCKAADAALSAPDVAIPGGVTIVKVDYDTATELRRTYGVTMQHTFVHVDGEGALVKKVVRGEHRGDPCQLEGLSRGCCSPRWRPSGPDC